MTGSIGEGDSYSIIWFGLWITDEEFELGERTRLWYEGLGDGFAREYLYWLTLGKDDRGIAEGKLVTKAPADTEEGKSKECNEEYFG